MRVLISGGTGFVGAALAARARDAGHQVVTLDVTTDADIVGDLGDEAATWRIVLDARPDAIVHLAARLTDAADADPVAATRTNTLGTAALFAAAEAAGAGRVIYASSNAAVGPCPPGTGDAAVLDPRTLYGATKAFGEHLARAMSERPHAPSYLALRFGWIYGPGRERGWREMQSVLERVADGERDLRYPEPAHAIDWTWIDDAVDVLLRCLLCPLPRFAALNAVGDQRRTADAIAHLRRRFPDLRAHPVPTTFPPSAWGLVNEGLASLIGPVSVTPLETGIDRILAARAATMAERQ